MFKPIKDLYSKSSCAVKIGLLFSNIHEELGKVAY